MKSVRKDVILILSSSMAKSTTGAEHIYEKQVKIKIRSWQNDGYQEDLVLEAQKE